MTSGSPQVRRVRADDAAAITVIYNHYVAHTVVTFEEAAVPAEEMARRVGDIEAADLPWLVAEDERGVIGYAHAMKWRQRSAYRFSVEITIYLDPGARGSGIGTKLYAALFPELERLGIHAVMGGIALPNDASVRLHERFGMEKVAHFRAVGRKFDRWIDVGYWERLLGQL